MASLGIPSGRSVGAIAGKSEALGTIAVGIGDVEFGIALHRRREHDLRAVRAPSRRSVGAAETAEGDEFVGVEGIHADLRADDAIDGSETGEGDAGSVGGPARSQRDTAKRSESVLIGAVVIHDPKFFVAGASADEGDLGGGDAGSAAGKFVDDFVGKLVGEFADLGVGGSAAINLADDCLGGGIADVVHPGIDDHFRRGFSEIAESNEIGIERGIGPGKETKFAGLGERLGGIKAGADEINDAGEGEVVADDGSEEGGVGVGFVGARNEIGDSDARLLHADAGASAEPALFLLSVEERCGE